MTRIAIKLLFASFICFGMFACVPIRQFEDMKVAKEKCEEENNKFKLENQDLKTAKEELNSNQTTLSKQILALKGDTSILGTSYRRLTNNYDQLNDTYELLLKKYEQLLAGNAADNQKITNRLMETQGDLQKREDELRQLQKDLEEKQRNLAIIESDLNKNKMLLEEKNKRLIELENILNRQDSVVNALRKKVSAALIGFEGEGLTVKMKNGKVYVQLEENLLFASGSWDIAQKGQDALSNLAEVLNTNEDINVLVEGHTDNIPYKGNVQVKDNWDLSVMRATAIVKILINNNVNPQRLAASGRAEYFPIEDNATKEGRAKNRRTEIILTPKLDELFQIIENK